MRSGFTPAQRYRPGSTGWPYPRRRSAQERAIWSKREREARGQEPVARPAPCDWDDE